MDTIKIESKGRNLDLTRLMNISDLNSDRKSIFSYNEFDHSIDQIDLENQVILNNYPFEKDGPNGTGEHFYEFNALKGERFFVQSFEKSAIYDISGRLIQKVDWRNSKDSNGEKYAEFPRRQILVELENLLAFGLSYDDENREVNLDVLSMKDNIVNRLFLNSKKSYSDLILAIDNTTLFIDPEVYLSWQDSTIIVSYEFSNEIILFDPKSNDLRFVDYNPTLTPKSVKPINVNSINSKEQLQKEFQHYLEQVKYYPPVWDDMGKQYYRLSTKRIFFEGKDEKSLVPETQKIKVFLSIFDSSFNLTKELEIKEFLYSNEKYFAKDGKLWVFHNFSDELGFIIINI
ncbi:DUF4221 domain-containing protein [Belliella sp. DSM 111904]|uniref:DUF4221 domain-containing protein n=1 Tax=Belliella filtrata TaxID=2923435 RepID=A0ABS9V2M4_9BACT|nr:DUF4221 family protein [Belliella filtrata]MCH7410658.1 DUF4221 domain-containing protein [Belliella filtrata]